MKQRLIQAAAVVLIVAYVGFMGYAVWELMIRPRPVEPTVEELRARYDREIAAYHGEPKGEGYWDRMERLDREKEEKALVPIREVVEQSRDSAVEAVRAAQRAEASAEATWEVAYETAYADIEQDTTPFTDLVQTSLKGVVHLSCPYWQGSGFVVGPRLIVTARHCVDGVEDFLITTNDGHQVRATRAISDKKHDVAFIRVDDLTCVAEERGTKAHKTVLHPLSTGSIKDCVLGQNVYVIGSPYGKVNFNSLTTGVISGVDVDWSPLGEDYGWKVAFTVDSAGHPGNSGCPVFTTDGVVRGILVGGFSPVLISVMPCDLFMGDLDSIRLMFAQDRYAREEASGYDYYYDYGWVIESEDRGVEGRDAN